MTRWSAHYEAVRIIKNGYTGILQTVKYIYQDSKEKPECKQVAKNLYHKLVKMKYAILTVIWEVVLERFNKTSKKLQTSSFDVFKGYLCYHLYLGLFQPTGLHNMNQKGLCEDITLRYYGLSK